MHSVEDIVETIGFFDDWEDRYRYVIELGRKLAPLDESARIAANKVQGCASQVWLRPVIAGGRFDFQGDSDAMIVRGLIAVLLRLFSGKPAAAIVAFDPKSAFERLGLAGHLSAQRSNGLASMAERIRRDAEAPATV